MEEKEEEEKEFWVVSGEKDILMGLGANQKIITKANGSFLPRILFVRWKVKMSASSKDMDHLIDLIGSFAV